MWAASDRYRPVMVGCSCITMGDFKRLVVWNEAQRLTIELYARSADFPTVERFGLTAQIRRAAASIGANVAEGCGREGTGDMKRFIRIARGSAYELEHHLLLARDLGLMSAGEWSAFDRRVQRLSRMLAGLLRMPSE